MRNIHLRTKAINLRKQGMTYSQILISLSEPVTKSTLSYWLKSIKLTNQQNQRIKLVNLKNLGYAREAARKIQSEKRNRNLIETRNEFASLRPLLENQKIAKIALIMLYLCEGSLTRKGGLMFGNSNPYIITLFLHFLRKSYAIQEDKFRCTVQCRADQNPEELKKFWSRTTGIQEKYFYRPQIDKRTIGKVTKKPEYRGVCRIDYFSAKIYNELTEMARLLGKESSLGL